MIEPSAALNSFNRHSSTSDTVGYDFMLLDHTVGYDFMLHDRTVGYDFRLLDRTVGYDLMVLDRTVGYDISVSISYRINDTLFIIWYP